MKCLRVTGREGCVLANTYGDGHMFITVASHKKSFTTVDILRTYDKVITERFFLPRPIHHVHNLTLSTDADADVSSEPLALARYRRAHPSEGPSCLNPISNYRIVQLVQRIRKLNTSDMISE